MAMASASTSAAVNTRSPTNSVYDVFLSHRGPDTKNRFTSHLYHRLVLHGFRVFWDKEEMQVGKALTSQIREAIESASVQVAILSKGYADSEWCLEELHLMVESKKPIVPVFFDVQPTAVRQTHGKGVYAQALGRMKNKKTYGSQRRYSSTTIEKWSKALSTVGNISGLELDKFNNGDQGALLEKVVASVGKHLGKPGLDVAKHPTGLDEKIKDFKKKVQRQQSVKAQVIGIEGSCGIGKTTLAKQFFILQSSQYHKSCFLFDIREKALKDSLESFRALTQKDENIESVEGIKLLEIRLSNCEALVILDDVDHINQLNALLTPIRDVLHPHSLILITSRDRDVLTRSRVEEPSIYKMTDLDPQQSRELFCMHAFTQPHPLPGFEALVDKYLKACNGLPLSLQV